MWPKKWITGESEKTVRIQSESAVETFWCQDGKLIEFPD